MRIAISVISLFATLGLGYLALDQKSLASFIAFLVSLVTFLTSLANMKKKPEGNTNKKINQKIGKNGSGIQIGGDVNINSKKD
ncbi:TPA: hypothetical protein ACGD69_004158 [Serratia marcescens]|uniref:hypothetical protein n=1 Tax=Serratia TaxID=613 RepID=UPI00074557C5|nr:MULTISPECIES: hypothetical protein [Serratia]ASM29693.1 hypothetical protein BVG84_01190 [Serratia marcescens]MBH2535201.1 hypothetical protein [Serratia marcescens]MBH3195025.1 hypothetical protein [Serratia marcescens]MBN5418433.1 hypothetical protein [Serratia marcescens]QDI12434.1 hypothetical protein FBF84_04355 [Serratia marcescens]